jgi:hypothetical protein
MSLELDHIGEPGPAGAEVIEPNASRDQGIPPPPEPPRPREVPPKYSWQQAGKDEPELPPGRSWDAEGEEYERRRDRRQRYVECPGCGYDVPEGASRCMRCGEYIDEEDFRPVQRSRRDCLPHRGGLVLALGIASLVLASTVLLGVVGLPLGIVAWVLGQGDLRKMSRNEMDPDGRSLTQGGLICGIIGVFLNLLVLLSCGFLIWWADNAYTPTPTRQRFNTPSSPSTPRF